MQNEDAHRALDRVGIPKGVLPMRVMAAVEIIEAQRVHIRSLEEELNKALHDQR